MDQEVDVKYLRKTFVVENSTSEKTVQRTESVIKSRESCVSSKVCDNGDFRKKRVTTPYISNERFLMKKKPTSQIKKWFRPKANHTVRF